MSVPNVPARPARSQHQAQNPSTQSTSLEPPQVPSRPERFSARDTSCERDAYSRSPLNELPTTKAGAFHQRHPSYNSSLSNARPPGVASLPLIGQEGSEYASLDNIVDDTTLSPQLSQSPSHTRNVHEDLPLHAPTASMAPKTSKERIAAAIRTDSSSAGGAGIGKEQPEQEGDDMKLQYTASSGHNRSQDTQEHRSASTKPNEEHEHGIPMIGYQVPMYPNAGDVQAPSPSPFQQSQSTGVGFFNDVSNRASSAEHRRKSGHNFHVPPGSYGLHGHGGGPQDQFEKAWYQKHPKDASHEDSLHVERSQYSMTSEELNNLVRSTSRTGSGMGTSPAMISTPSETIGYQATEEYAHRIASRPPSLYQTESRTGSFGHADSPLRRTIFPVNDDKVTDDDAEDNVIHVRPPSRNVGKITGGGYDPPTEDLGPHGGNTREQGGWINERGSGTPILASDELARDPGAEYRLPAVSPEQERIGDTYFSGVDSDHPQPYQSGRSKSRSRSRPNAGHSALSRFVSHDHHHDSSLGTPLKEIEEYEPLFNDDDVEAVKRPETAADRLKRPELEKHRFPSQDIWEDTPSSLQLQTTVEHEQEREESPIHPQPSTDAGAASLFESPEKEAARKGEILENERLDFINDPSKGMAKSKFIAHVQQEAVAAPRGPQQRFPSHDIWEDTPDSLRLETTIDEPQSPQDEASPIEPRSLAAIATNTATMKGADRPSSLTSAPPSVPARPGQSLDSTEQSQPSVPARPSRVHEVPVADIVTSPTEKHSESSPLERKAPSIPQRPKPQVPARPSRPTHDNSPEAAGPAPSINADLTPSEAPAPAISKPKPLVPARPVGTTSKFASLKAGFMENLNSRLQLGPQAPPKPQPTAEDAAAQDEEKAPLADARKSRAKGPARRKPATSTAEEATTASSSAHAVKFSIATPWTVWSISTAPSSANDVNLGAAAKRPKPTPTAADLGEYPTASPLARNTAGEALLSSQEAPKTASGALAHGADAAMDARAHAEEEESSKRLKGYTEESIGFRGDVPEPAAEKPLSEYTTPLPQRDAEMSHDRKEEKAHESTAKVDVDDLDVPGAFPDESVEASDKGMVNEAVQTGEKTVAAGGEAQIVYLDGAAQTAADVVTARPS